MVQILTMQRIDLILLYSFNIVQQNFTVANKEVFEVRVLIYFIV